MDAGTRRQAELAERLHDWVQAHPSEDPAYATIAARVTTVSAMFRALTDAQIDGVEQARVATQKILEVRRTLTQELLPHLVRVAKTADRNGANTGAAYINPARSIANHTLLRIAQSAQEAATADEPVLTANGLSATLLPQLAAATARLEGLIAARNVARGTHVGARSELRNAVQDLRSVTLLLDSFNRLRYPARSKELADWTRTKTLLGARRTPAAPPATDADVSPAA